MIDVLTHRKWLGMLYRCRMAFGDCNCIAHRISTMYMNFTNSFPSVHKGAYSIAGAFPWKFCCQILVSFVINEWCYRRKKWQIMKCYSVQALSQEKNKNKNAFIIIVGTYCFASIFLVCGNEFNKTNVLPWTYFCNHSFLLQINYMLLICLSLNFLG